MPDMNFPSKRGDIIIRFDIIYPLYMSISDENFCELFEDEKNIPKQLIVLCIRYYNQCDRSMLIQFYKKNYHKIILILFYEDLNDMNVNNAI